MAREENDGDQKHKVYVGRNEASHLAGINFPVGKNLEMKINRWARSQSAYERQEKGIVGNSGTASKAKQILF